MCNCIEKIRENEIAASKDRPVKINYVRFDLANIVTWANNYSKKLAENQTGQQVWLGEEWVDKKGNTKKKERKTFYTHIYCPFCGVKYIQN